MSELLMDDNINKKIITNQNLTWVRHKISHEYLSWFKNKNVENEHQINIIF